MTDLAVNLTQFLAAGLHIALAVWVWSLNLARGDHRALAIWLLVRGGALASQRIELLTDGAASHAWGAMARHFHLWAIVALLVFVFLYVAPRTRARQIWTIGVALLAPAASLFLMSNECLDVCATNSQTRLGPIFLAIESYPFVAGAAGLLLVVAASQQKPALARGTIVAASGLLLNAVFDGTIFLADALLVGPGWLAAQTPDIGIAWAATVVRVLALTVGIVGVLYMAAAPTATSPQKDASNAWRLALSALAAAGSGAIVAFEFGAVGVAAAGFWRMVVPILISYALIRHCILDVDLRLRWTVQRGTWTAILVAVFFVVSEAAQELFSGWSGSPYLGIVAAGSLLFAIQPLERVVQRVGNATVPPSRTEAVLAQDAPAAARLSLYREQAAIMWADGVMGRRERALLDSLRTRLSIPAEAAMTAEHEAAFGTM